MCIEVVSYMFRFARWNRHADCFWKWDFTIECPLSCAICQGESGTYLVLFSQLLKKQKNVYTCLYGFGRCSSQVISVLESVTDLHTGKEIRELIFFFSECNKWRTFLLSKCSFTRNTFYLCLDEKMWLAK